MKKKKALIIIALIIIVLMVVGIVFYFLKKNVTSGVDRSKYTSVALDNDKVTKAYQYINLDGKAYITDNIYQTTMVNYDKLSDQEKDYMIYNYIFNGSLLDIQKISSCDVFKGYNSDINGDLYDYCISNKIMEDKDNNYYVTNVTKKVMNNYYTIYAVNEVAKANSFVIGPNGECVYSSDKDDFVCYYYKSKGEVNNYVYTNVYDAKENDQELVLYTHYLYCAPDYVNSKEILLYTCYSNSNKENKLADNVNLNETFKQYDQGQKYISVFKKIGESYYWYSTEMSD